LVFRKNWARTAPMHIFPARAKIDIGEPTTISTREIQMTGRTLAELPRFPGASRVLYYGYLTPAKLTPLSVHRDRYDSIALRLDKVRLEHAEYRDIEEQGISHLVIREGTVLAKIHDLPPAVNNVSPDESELKKVIRLVELRLRPDDQVLVAEGIQVTPSQVIARRDIWKQLRTLDLQLAADTERLQADIGQIDLQLGALERELKSGEAVRAKLKGQLQKLGSEMLLGKEVERIDGKLSDQETRVEDFVARHSLLLSRRFETIERVRSVVHEAAERREIIVRETQIIAGFQGRIVRIIREAAASEVTLRISYEASRYIEK